MKLKDLKDQPKLTQEEIYARFPSLSPNLPAHKIGTVSRGGVVNLESGSFVIDDFIEHGRFIVKFGKVKATNTIRINNILSLDGCPQEVDGSLDIRSGSLTSLEGGPKKINALYVDAANLASLKGAPAEASMFWVSSEVLTSLRGISHGAYKQAVFTGCKQVISTHGLKGMRFEDYVLLPVDLHEISEIPDHASTIGYPACYNVARLMLVNGLTSLKLKLHDNLAPKQVKAAKDVDEVLQLVLKRASSPKQRYLLAQQELIEAGFDDLVE